MNYLVRIDLHILRFIEMYVKTPVLDDLFYIITSIGNWGAIWMAIAVICILQKKHRKTGFLICIALAIGALSSEIILKPFFERNRPFVAYTDIVTLLENTPGFSFPSGHTTSSFAAFTVIYKRKKNMAWVCVSLGLALAIAFSRIYFFVHYPSDIVAGILVGVVAGVAALYIGNRISKD